MAHQIGMKLRVQIHRFSGQLCRGMGKVLDAMGRAYQATSRRGIFVIDRAGDR